MKLQERRMENQHLFYISMSFMLSLVARALLKSIGKHKQSLLAMLSFSHLYAGVLVLGFETVAYCSSGNVPQWNRQDPLLASLHLSCLCNSLGFSIFEPVCSGRQTQI